MLLFSLDVSSLGHLLHFNSSTVIFFFSSLVCYAPLIDTVLYHHLLITTHLHRAAHLLRAIFFKILLHAALAIEPEPVKVENGIIWTQKPAELLEKEYGTVRQYSARYGASWPGCLATLEAAVMYEGSAEAMMFLYPFARQLLAGKFLSYAP